MAERRMFTKRVTDDDHFMSLSASAQALYLHLSMSADDDGFCNQVAVCMFKAHASTGDLEALLSNRYLYQFDNGVIVIKHWRMANALRKDRYTPTAFQEELSHLQLKENGSYTMVAERLPDGCQTVAACLPQDRLGKDRTDKDIHPSGVSRFAPPTLEEVKEYCRERGNEVDPEKFIDFYESKGWMIGKNKMKDWKAAVRTWERSLGTTSVTTSKKRGPDTFFNYKQAGECVDLKSIEATLDTDFGASPPGLARSRRNNTLLNYREQGTSIEEIKLDLDEL